MSFWHVLPQPIIGLSPMDGVTDAAFRFITAQHDVLLEVVLEQAQPVELTSQNNYLRRLQHQLAERYGLMTESKGAEPHRRVVIYPG